ncbi:MAG: malate synthase, partial [Cyclobacteriaceae bacterium]
MSEENIIIRDHLEEKYQEIFTPEVLEAFRIMTPFNDQVKKLMDIRMRRRQERKQKEKRIDFLNPETNIAGTDINVQDARDGKFEGGEVPKDLQRQWIQGTGPGAKPNAPLESSIRNVAYALLSGADGWMFDGEDALGQTSTMSLDNQLNLKLAFQKSPVFLKVAEEVAHGMNLWSKEFFGEEKVKDWKSQLDFTTKIFRARGLHLDDRHIRTVDGHSFSASIADLVLYVTNNHKTLSESGASIVLYLPKIQTAEEAALWNRMIGALE